MVVGSSVACQNMSHRNHTPPPTSQISRNKLSGWQESSLFQIIQRKLNTLSRKVQVPKSKDTSFSCGPFRRFYKRSISKTRWSDLLMLAVFDISHTYVSVYVRH